VVGPNADDGLMQLGNYNGTPSSIVTILDGIKTKFPNAEIIYEKGCEVADPSSRTSLYQNFISQKNGEKGMKVEFFNNNEFKGTPVNISVNKTGINYNSFGGTQLAPVWKRKYIGDYFRNFQKFLHWRCGIFCFNIRYLHTFC
jgi:beta-glucosidase